MVLAQFRANRVWTLGFCNGRVLPRIGHRILDIVPEGSVRSHPVFRNEPPAKIHPSTLDVTLTNSYLDVGSSVHAKFFDEREIGSDFFTKDENVGRTEERPNEGKHGSKKHHPGQDGRSSLQCAIDDEKQGVVKGSKYSTYTFVLGGRTHAQCTHVWYQTMGRILSDQETKTFVTRSDVLSNIPSKRMQKDPFAVFSYLENAIEAQD
ncbi:hypothetical protein PsorP6_011396 [Peronosclerospora sorghi]|uniref:Uncharacterized protein n=1 Tax=Peronosclerospora sorghi TaxID=230839 RepID=A0ACC0WIT4_9STRA|nr:hypothetical protein PsorP6_011396 [Peronosclerospora sorghi]